MIQGMKKTGVRNSALFRNVIEVSDAWQWTI
jgi:hypothetical protein